MNLYNGLLTDKAFIEINESFNQASKLFPNHSLFIEYLRFRYYDAYDMNRFVNRLTNKDKEENTPIYQRKEIEYKDYINRLYGPFFSGKDEDDLSIIQDKPYVEIIKLIIDSSELNNEKMVGLLNITNTNNVYDFYKSLYLQKLVNKSIDKEKISIPVEEDEEYTLWNYTNLRHEQDGRKTISIASTPKELWPKLIEDYRYSEIESTDEPNNLKDIIKNSNFDKKTYNVLDYERKLKGAILGRFIGCMLGAPVENWSVEAMEKFANETNTVFPPIHYWNKVTDEENLHYKRDKKYLFTKEKMNCVVADDDVTYTVLNAVVMNKYGKEFTSSQLANFWKEHLPYACTAEYATMVGVRRNKNIEDIVNSNPYVELIGAAIRADSFGYACPGDPYNAAILAYKDACISHKRNGIYGEMFLAATIAASFAVSSPLEAIKIGMNYIPKNCRLMKDLLWALSYEGKDLDYKQANRLITERFKYMNKVHTNNNMCAIVFSFIIGGNDFDKVISNCIAMGYDNDCTGASVGSIIGAILTHNGIDEKWYKPFNNEIHTYIRGYETISIDNLIEMIKNI